MIFQKRVKSARRFVNLIKLWTNIISHSPASTFLWHLYFCIYICLCIVFIFAYNIFVFIFDQALNQYHLSLTSYYIPLRVHLYLGGETNDHRKDSHFWLVLFSGFKDSFWDLGNGLLDCRSISLNRGPMHHLWHSLENWYFHICIYQPLKCSWSLILFTWSHKTPEKALPKIISHSNLISCRHRCQHNITFSFLIPLGLFMSNQGTINSNLARV